MFVSDKFFQVSQIFVNEARCLKIKGNMKCSDEEGRGKNALKTTLDKHSSLFLVSDVSLKYYMTIILGLIIDIRLKKHYFYLQIKAHVLSLFRHSVWH